MSHYQSNQIKLLQQYISCLQKQNQTKNIQRHTLYIQLERLQQQLQSLEGELLVAKSRVDSTQTTQLKSRIRDLQQEVMILKYEQQHLFEENLSLISTLEESSNKIFQVERENKELKSQKEQLERFRLTLQKISKNLEEIELQRFTLAQANMVLTEQNLYLKSLLSEQQISQQKQPQPSHSNQQQQLLHQHQHQITSISNYLMSSSFQKISEYEQEYEQSNENDSKNNSRHKLHSLSIEKSIQHQGEQQDVNENSNSDEKQLRDNFYQQRDQHSQSSYLIFDDKSGESFNLSYQVHKPNLSRTYKPNQLYKILNNSNSIDQRIKLSPHNNNNDQSSCDVIQQLHQQTSQYLPSITCQQDQLSQLKQKLSISQNQRLYLQKKIIQMEKSQHQNVAQMETKIGELLKNYQVIVKYVQKLEKQNLSYKQNIQELQCFKQKAEQYFLELQQDQQRKRIQQNKISYEIDDQNKTIYNSIQQLDRSTLVKQHNELIEKVNELQKQKTNLYYRVTQSQYSSRHMNTVQFSHQQQHEDKQNHMINLNYQRPISSNYKESVFSEKQRNSLTFRNQHDKPHMRRRNSFTARIQQNSQHEKRRSNDQSFIVKQRLQKRIQTIKQQNLQLLKELEYY